MKKNGEPDNNRAGEYTLVSDSTQKKVAGTYQWKYTAAGNYFTGIFKPVFGKRYKGKPVFNFNLAQGYFEKEVKWENGTWVMG